MPVLIAAMGIALACSDEPTDSPAELTGPQLAKGGKKGPPPSGDKPITVAYGDNTGDNIRSDGRGTYEDGCNVSARFNLNDAILNLKGKIKRKDQEACGDPRFISVAFTNSVQGSPAGNQDGNTVQGSFMNVDSVETVTEADGTVDRSAIFHLPGCALGLKFSPGEAEQPFYANHVQVTKNPDGTWTVATKPDPNDVAVCVPSTPGRVKSYYHMPFRITVELK
jgi:hypothetical protein